MNERQCSLSVRTRLGSYLSHSEANGDMLLLFSEPLSLWKTGIMELVSLKLQTAMFIWKRKKEGVL